MDYEVRKLIVKDMKSEQLIAEMRFFMKSRIKQDELGIIRFSKNTYVMIDDILEEIARRLGISKAEEASASTCKDCRFFVRNDDDSIVDECRRCPPSWNGNGECDFVYTSEHDWCGEFKAKENK